jgi:hypothetical protein
LIHAGGKGKESEDISTLEELSASDVQKWKSADANDDSEGNTKISCDNDRGKMSLDV